MSEAVFYQRNGLIGVVVAAPGGIISAEQLKKLGFLLQELDCPACKMTTRQTLVVLVAEDKVEQFKDRIREIGLAISAYGNVVRNIKVCCGSPDLCSRTVTDVLGLGIKLQEEFMGQPVPKDFKIAIAGCHRGCTDPFCADLGIVAVGPNSFSLYLGGRGGSRSPEHGQLLIENIDENELSKAIGYILDRYRTEALPHERLCRTINRVGKDKFELPLDSLQLKLPDQDEFLKFAGLA